MGAKKRSWKHLHHDGQTRSAAEWATITGIDLKVIYARLGKDWSVDRVLTTPTQVLNYLSTEQESEAVTAYLGGESSQSIGARFGVHGNTVIRALRRHEVAVAHKGPPLSAIRPEERRGVAERYSAGESMKSLAADFGVSSKAIANAIVEQGVMQRTHRDSCSRHSLDESAFDDLAEAARFWIGFLMADGCVVKDARSDSWQVVLVAAEKDAEIIHAFKAFLKTESPIQQRPAGEPHLFPKGHFAASGPHLRLSVGSKRLAEELAKYGVTPRKSLTARVIGLENCPHFWRGAVCGDGMVTWHKDRSGKRYPLIGLYGSAALLEQFEAFARGICPAMKATRKPHGNIFGLRTAGAPAADIVRVLFGDCSIALARKWETAKAILAQNWKRPSKGDCATAGCARVEWSKGLCRNCYKNAWKRAKRLKNPPPRRNRSFAHLSYETLDALRRECGSWAAVGRKLDGADPAVLGRLYKKLAAPSAPR